MRGCSYPITINEHGSSKVYHVYERKSNAQDRPSSLGQFQECDRAQSMDPLNEGMQGGNCNDGTKTPCLYHHGVWDGGIEAVSNGVTNGVGWLVIFLKES